MHYAVTPMASPRRDWCHGIISFSINSTAANSNTPIIDNTTSAANINGKSKFPLAIWRT